MHNRSSLGNQAALTLPQGRESFAKRAWGAAFSQLLQADQETPLDPQDLVLLAQAAILIGRESEGADYLARAHQGFLSCGKTQPAARCAFWLGFMSLLNGEQAKAGGWLARAGRMLEGHPDCAEQGYLLIATAYRLFHTGDPEAAHKTFVQAGVVGEQFNDKDLIAMSLQGQGRSLIRQGRVAAGVTLLDEAMVAVTAGEVSALNAGGVYCSVLDACGEIFDLRRAREWTSALERWCASQPDLVPFRGHCLVRRAELLQIHGAWQDALAWAQRAVEWLATPTPKPAIASAFYQLAEIHRVLGNLAAAEEAYNQAAQLSRTPRPGLAQLRLAQGDIDSANSEIRRVAEEVQEPWARAKVLHAFVDIVLAGNNTAAARQAADELKQISENHDILFLRALSSSACGAVLLAEGDTKAALVDLRNSWRLWCDLDAPYEASRVQVLIGLACQKAGDATAAMQEFTAARDRLRKLGAASDLARVEALLAKPATRATSALTDRELEVLRLVASGMTNRKIAAKLKISEKTVARHLSNIFMKLDLSSRSAATAYAYDHKLV